MNNLDLIRSLKDTNGLFKSKAEKVVHLFFNEIAEALAKGDRAEIRGFRSIFLKE
jgi:integration host factor subunit beta